MTANTDPRPGQCCAIIDPIHIAGIERLEARFNLIRPGEEGSAAQIARTEVAVVRTSLITAAWIARRPVLRLIVKHGSGVDNIDIAAATRSRVLVSNTPGGANATAVAEGAVTLMLAVLRRVREMDALVREGRFADRWSLELGDLSGSRLGLVGFGQIARIVARICGAGFGMKVSAYDPFVPAADMAQAGVLKADDLLSLMAGSDAVSIHVPFSPETRNLIGETELAAMKPSSIIVNTSRGGLIDEQALARFLARRQIRGAGLDVFDQEPPPADHPLLQLPNAVLSPHVAGVTNGSMKGMALAVADIVEAVMAGRRPATLLNAVVLGEAV